MPWSKWNDRDGVPPWSIAFRAPQETVEFEARIPTAHRGLWFAAAFALTITWNGASEATRSRIASEVQRDLIRAACQRSKEFELGDMGVAQAEIVCELLDDPKFSRPQVRTMQLDITLTASDQDVALARELEQVGPRHQLFKAVHEARMERVRTLRRDVLIDPTLARVWWFEQHPERLQEVEKAGAVLDHILSAPDRLTVDTSTTGGQSVVDAFIAGLEEWERATLVTRFAEIFEAFERQDLADHLRKAWPSDQSPAPAP